MPRTQMPPLLGLCLVVLTLVGTLVPCASASEPEDPAAALDAYLAGQAAWRDGQEVRAIESWDRAAELSPDFLPPRLMLVKAWVGQDLSKASSSFRECVEIARRSYPAQHWLTATGILGLVIAGLVTASLVMLGFLLRHGRALHHALAEGIAYLARRRGAFPYLAWGLLLVPLVANFGLWTTGLFWLFLASFRFGRGERIAALFLGAFAVLVGPVLYLTAGLWSESPHGGDASAIAKLEEAPGLPAHRAEILDWRRQDVESGAAVYLEGLAAAEASDDRRAFDLFQQAGHSGQVPARLLETNEGNALLALGQRDAAFLHYERAISIEPEAFEPHYNLAVANAAKGEFLAADRELDRASRVNLDRLRALGRIRADGVPHRPLAARWTARELWSWSLARDSQAMPPRLLLGALPMQSLLAAPLFAMIAIGVGLVAGHGLRRLIHVHVCYQCARPVCRRCLVRLNRRAYCARCAETLGGHSAEETTRLLLQRLLNERPSWSGQFVPILAAFIPGVGPALHGRATLGFLTASLAGVGVALASHGIWGPRLLPLPWDDGASGWLQTLGLLAILGAVGLSAAGVWLLSRDEAGFRAFLSRDVDRLAA